MNFDIASDIPLEKMSGGIFFEEYPELVELLRSKSIHTVGDLARRSIFVRSLPKRKCNAITNALYESGYCFLSKYDDSNFTCPSELSDYVVYERWLDKRKFEISHTAKLLLLGLGYYSQDQDNVDGVVENITDLALFGHSDPKYAQFNSEGEALSEWLEEAHWVKMSKNSIEE